jgi:hypothetical protein
MSSANCCEFVFTGSAGLLRLDRVFVGTLVSSGSLLPASGLSDELDEYPPELDELLELPALPASCNPPGGAGFPSPELDEAGEPEPPEDEEEPAGCSPGYGNCCAGLFGASCAPGVCAPDVAGFGACFSPGYGNCCAAFDGTG